MAGERSRLNSWVQSNWIVCEANKLALSLVAEIASDGIKKDIHILSAAPLVITRLNANDLQRHECPMIRERGGAEAPPRSFVLGDSALLVRTVQRRNRC